jgi:putative FmdB family regulatory protein
MPIYEYSCRDCGREFEAFVTAARVPMCPACQSQALERQLSVFAVSTGSSGTASNSVPCGACGDPRGPGACSLN